MRQFDVFVNPFRGSRERQPFLVSLQSDLLARNFDTVVVAPLELVSSDTFFGRLNPTVEVDGRQYVVVIQEIVAVRKSVLGSAHSSLSDYHDQIMAALDMLFTGF